MHKIESCYSKAVRKELYKKNVQVKDKVSCLNTIRGVRHINRNIQFQTLKINNSLLKGFIFIIIFRF